MPAVMVELVREFDADVNRVIAPAPLGSFDRCSNHNGQLLCNTETSALADDRASAKEETPERGALLLYDPYMRHSCVARTIMHIRTVDRQDHLLTVEEKSD